MAITQLLHLKNIKNNTQKLIAGVDEAGRGALAGPVVATAIILTKNIDTKKLKDSKILSKEKRKKLYHYLLNNTHYISTCIVSHHDIDKINILNATMKAMKIAIINLKKKPSQVLIDGNQTPNIKNYNTQTIIKGDQLEAVISAASIIAKETRDNIMKHYSKQYPHYYFEKNKGYGTKIHYDQLFKYGKSPIHRCTFNINKQLKLI